VYRRHSIDRGVPEPREFIIRLPFKCDEYVFADPMRGEDEWHNPNVGLFPIDARGETYGPNAPAPSMKKLSLTC